MQSKYKEIQYNQVGEGFRRIDAWESDDPDEKGKAIALIDTLTGRIIYLDKAARGDPYAQHIINRLSAAAQRKHPFSVARLETILRGVIEYELRKPKTTGYFNLVLMGFTKKEAAFFGWPGLKFDDEEEKIIEE